MKIFLTGSTGYLGSNILKYIDGIYFNYKRGNDILKDLNQDIIFFDPPWGGEDYDEHVQIMLTLGDKTMTQIVNTVSREFNFIVLKVPKNFDLDSFKKNLKEELTIVKEEDLKGGQRKVIKMKILIIKVNKLANTKYDDDKDDDYINYERNGGGETTDILNKNISKLKILLDTYRKSSQIDLPNYEIYVVRQQQKQVNYNIVPEEIVCNKNKENKNGFLKFNKGSLINTGCELAQKQNCDYIIIHNVHLLPKEDLIPEYFVYPENGPLNLSSSNDKYKLSGSFSPNQHERIGILSINTGHYQQINGFPNHMWGWGFEDKIFLDRLTKNNLYPKDIRYLENNITELSNIEIFKAFRDMYNNFVDVINSNNENTLNSKIIFKYSPNGSEPYPFKSYLKISDYPSILKQYYPTTILKKL